MKKIRISFVLNIIIVLFVIFASFCMFTGYRFMSGNELVLESNNLGMFRFFTVDSNLLMGIVALVFAYYELILLKKEIKEIPKFMYILKLMATTGVTLTCIITVTYLAYIVEGGVKVLLMNSNLFFHLLIPVLSMITFMFFENTNKLKFKDSFYGLVPMFIYAIYYVINILIHIENGKVSPEYDWYWFVQKGMGAIFIVIPVMLLITYLISLVLWKVNRRLYERNH